MARKSNAFLTKGRSFGIPYSHYERVCGPEKKGDAAKSHFQIPGPGSYDIDDGIGKHAKKFSLKSRVKEPSPGIVPPPGAYTPVYS